MPKDHNTRMYNTFDILVFSCHKDFMRNSNPQEHPSEFDPYLKWLGISAAERQGGKPNYYRLLGITPFLDDPDAISHAADRVMGHLRTFQAGKHSAQSQELLSEVVQAKLCLLDPYKKQAYDQTLRAVTPLPAYEVTRSPIAINTGDDGSSSDVRKRLHSNTDTAHWKYAAIIGGSAAAGTAILGGTVAMMRGGDAENTEPKREARASMDEREMQGTTFGMPQARLRDDVPAFDPGAATEESAPAPVPVREEKPVPQDVLAPSTVQDVPVQEEVADARDPRRDLADLMSQPQQYPGPRRPVTEQAEDAGAQLERVQQVSAKTLAAVVQRDEQGFAKIMDTLRSEGDGVVRAGMALGAAELAAQCGRVDLLQKALQRLEQDAGAFCTRAEVMLLKADIAMHIAPASITNPMLRRKDEEAWLKNEQQRVDVARVLMDGAMGAWQMDDNAQSSAYLARARQHIFGDTSSGLSGAFVGHKAYKEQGGPARKDLEEMEAENARQAAMLEQVQALLEGGASPQSSREHQSLGEYLLLARGDWEQGLPHIAQGTDRVMAEAAQRTLQGGETVEERAAVVRAWLRVAEGNERMRRVAENAASLHMRTLKGMTLTGPEKLVVDGLEREVGGMETDSTEQPEQPIEPVRPRNVPKEAVYWNGSWYWIIDKQMSFMDAYKYAHSIGASLVIPDTKEENEFIAKLANGKKLFLGIVKQKGIWTSDERQPHPYTNWDTHGNQPTDIPNESIVGMWREGFWHDVDPRDSAYPCLEIKAKK